MKRTKTGNFCLGFRRMGCPWQQDLTQATAFAKETGYECIDLQRDADESAAIVVANDVRVVCADLPDWDGLASADPDVRADAVATNSAYIQAAAESGVRCFFVVMFPGTQEQDRREAFAAALQGYGALDEVLRDHRACVVIEGYPGRQALVTTPETYRAFLSECQAPIAINYDPSHLIRMGIDPIRFLHEFAPQVRHVHAKDTEVDRHALYELGWEVPPLRAKPHGFGTAFWRYTIPGHGEMRWTEAFRLLEEAGFDGCVSVELEDERFNGTEAGEKEALRVSAEFLASC